MSEQRVRAYWITGAVAFLGVHYSLDVNDHLLAGLPRELRLSLNRLGPAEWCPRSHHVELLKAIASAHRDEAGAYQDLLTYGEYVGAEIASGALKQFISIAGLKLFAKKLPNLWLRDHQLDGRLDSDIAQLEESRFGLQLNGVRGYDHVGIATLGWIKGVLSRYTRRTIQVKQTGWSLAQPAPNTISGEVSWS
jgi:hypothetical protein